MESSAYFLAKAEQCRRLADTIFTVNDPAVDVLHALAAEFEAKAIELEARGASS